MTRMIIKLSRKLTGAGHVRQSWARSWASVTVSGENSGTFRLKTSSVTTIANTPSLKASNRAVFDDSADIETVINEQLSVTNFQQ